MKRRNFLKFSASGLAVTPLSGCVQPIIREEQNNKTKTKEIQATDCQIITQQSVGLKFRTQMVNFEPDTEDPIRIQLSALNTSENDYLLEQVISGELINQRISESAELVMLKPKEWGSDNTKINGVCHNILQRPPYPTTTGQTEIDSGQKITTLYDILFDLDTIGCPNSGIHEFKSFINVNHNLDGKKSFRGNIKTNIRINME